MKLRYAAALALVGWYLMMPPKKADGSLDISAPLSHWHVEAGFDSGQQCSVLQSATMARAFQANDRKQAEQIHAGQCIASDDPRLAK